jgi:hypothetical protein
LGNPTGVKVLVVATLAMNVGLCVTLVARIGYRRET